MSESDQSEESYNSQAHADQADLAQDVNIEVPIEEVGAEEDDLHAFINILDELIMELVNLIVEEILQELDLGGAGDSEFVIGENVSENTPGPGGDHPN